jgi:hypothetical protein
VPSISDLQISAQRITSNLVLIPNYLPGQTMLILFYRNPRHLILGIGTAARSHKNVTWTVIISVSYDDISHDF